MTVMVVYDSVFGNTEQIARAIAKTLVSWGDVGIFRVDSVKVEQLAGLDLLLVGSPTRQFRPTDGVRAFLQKIPDKGLAGVKVAAFDTRLDIKKTNSAILRFFVKIFGYAASPIAGRLVKKGGILILPPEGFIVNGTEGPLEDGELERAVAWAKMLINKMPYPQQVIR